MRKKTIQDAQFLASLKNGKCLSLIYEDANSYLWWICEDGHRWQSTYHNIQQGRWCLICSGNSKHTIQDCQELALLKNGKCLSLIYENVASYLWWQCEDGHRWQAIYNKIQQGQWCPDCADTTLTIQDAQFLASLRGGKCLSLIYKDNKKYLWWECEDGHKWQSRYSNIQQGSWCLICSGNSKNTIQDAQLLALLKNGKCLSINYKDAHSYLEWECEDGHKWSAKYSNIQQGQWCPDCKYKNEEIIRKFLINNNFEYIKQYQLKLPINITYSKIDFYIPFLNLFIEYNGIHHYRPKRYGDMTLEEAQENFEYQKTRDQQLREHCKNNNINLLEIDCRIYQNEKLEKYLYGYFINIINLNNIC
jgi:hypothetical protein